MKIGLIARADNRGIGYQTREFMRHMPVERVLIVQLPDSPWTDDFSMFPTDSLVTTFQPKTESLDCGTSRLVEWLTGLDVVFAVETLYDWNLVGLASSLGVKTVVQGNPEFYLHATEPWIGRPHPTQWWWPTHWLIDRLPGHVVPVPVPDDAPLVAADPFDGPLVVSFVIGHSAWRDRAGALVVQDALRLLLPEIEIRIFCQDPDLPIAVQSGGKQNIVIHTGGVDDRWSMYAGAHLLIAPRRYGGLSLPTNEAMAAGLAVAMSDGSPNRSWPIVPLRAMPATPIRCQSGPVPHLQVNPEDLASVVNDLHQNRDRLDKAQQAARLWAQQHSWSVLKDLYLDRFAQVCQ